MWPAIALGCALVPGAGCERRALVADGGAGGGGWITGGAGNGAGGGDGWDASGVGGVGPGGSGVGGGSGGCGLSGAAGTLAPSPAQCSDGIDNDADGKIDYDDPECLGPRDNDEGTFANGIPGDNTDACKQDCFFDDNTGSGDDRCQWQLKCDPRSIRSECPYDAAYAAQHPSECSLTESQGAVCLQTCGPRVANGCDCFGCCAVPGVPTAVRLTYTCTAAHFGDPTRCPPCTQVSQCWNPCDPCEICIGKPTVPAECLRPDGAAPYTCPGGAIACGAYGIAPALCPCGTACVTGCCLPLPPAWP